MPIHYQIIEGLQLVFVKGRGVVTAEDVVTHLDQLAGDDTYVAPMKKIVDYRHIEDLNQSLQEVHMIANKKQSLKDRFDGERCAIVSPSDLPYGISRMHTALMDGTEHIDTMAFRSMDEALQWLGVEMD